MSRAGPLVSVLMPCLNAADTLEEAVASVQLQDRSDWELIIADDGSSDDSPQIASRLAASDARILCLPATQGSPGSSAAAARNRALDAAQGRYIAFLDADDLWRPAKLSRQLEAMAASGAAFCCSAYAVHRPGKPPNIRSVPARMTRADLLRGNRIGCLTALYDVRVLGKQQMPDIPMRHDYALWLHLLTLTPYVIGIDEVLADHRRRPGSLSAHGWRTSLATWHMLRGEAGLSPLTAARTLALHTAGRLLRG